MSLVSFGLRLVASRLVRDRTWAGKRIFNSPIDPVAQWQSQAGVEGTEPCIAIYTGRRVADVVGKATQGKEARIDLVFNIFVPPSVVTAAVDDDGQAVITLETSNTGGAVVIDFMSRQIESALRFGPEPWKTIWDILVLSIDSVESRPLLYEVDKTVQIPCVEVKYSIKAVPDPDFGVPMARGWQMLFDAMSADPDYAEMAPLLQQTISAPPDLPDWRKIQAALGMSDAAINSHGIVPLAGP